MMQYLFNGDTATVLPLDFIARRESVDRMTTLGQRVRERRKALGLTQEDLEGRSGISQTHISQVETGITKQPTDATLFALSESLDIPMRELRQLAGYIIEEVTLNPVTIPVQDWGLSPADCVRWVEAVQEGRTLDVPLAHAKGRSPDDLFVLHATGSCLAQRGIANGSIVVCELANGRQPRDGQIVAVRVGDERSLKIWQRNGRAIRLYDGDDNIVATLTEADDIEVVGFVLSSWTDHDG